MESPCPTPPPPGNLRVDVYVIFRRGGAWDRSIPCWGKAEVSRGKFGLGKVANIAWHKISSSEIKNSTFRPVDHKTSNLEKCPI